MVSLIQCKGLILVVKLKSIAKSIDQYFVVKNQAYLEMKTSKFAYDNPKQAEIVSE